MSPHYKFITHQLLLLCNFTLVPMMKKPFANCGYIFVSLIGAGYEKEFIRF